jgi:hypothetical protein
MIRFDDSVSGDSVSGDSVSGDLTSNTARAILCEILLQSRCSREMWEYERSTTCQLNMQVVAQTELPMPQLPMWLDL